MPPSLRHIPVGEVSVEGLIGHSAVGLRLARPLEVRPSQLGREGVEVPAFASVEVGPVAEEKPALPANLTAFGLLEVDAVKHEAGVRAEDLADIGGQVLCISSSAVNRGR